jgi:hypothetical protein
MKAGAFLLGEDFWDPEDKLSIEEVLNLESPFSEEEIKEAIFSSYPEGGPGPDGLSSSFIRSSRRWLRVICSTFLKISMRVD